MHKNSKSNVVFATPYLSFPRVGVAEGGGVERVSFISLFLNANLSGRIHRKDFWKQCTCANEKECRKMWQFAFTCCDKITTGCRRTVKSNVKENEYNK